MFPCKSGTKVPIVTNGHLDATADPEVIRKWWKMNSNANIGLSLAASGLVAIDLDLYKPGCEWAVFSKGKSIPETFTQRSARGGIHYIFATEPGESFPGKLCNEVEIKHQGYIVLAPSIFEGKRYEITLDLSPAPCPDWVPRKQAGAALPDWLLKLAREDAGRGISTDPADLPEPVELGEIAAVVAVIPNEDLDWGDWNRVGMAIYRATGGTSAGLEIFHDFSRKSQKYDPADVDARWDSYHSCPPTEIGVGTLFYLANEARQGHQEVDEIDRLAALSPIEYDQERKATAKRLNMRVTTLDKLVESRRPSQDESGQGRPLELPDVVPWEHPVDGEKLLEDVINTFGRHVTMNETHIVAVALWTIHTHCTEKAEHFPRLHVSSPVARCGKTTLLATIEVLVLRPLKTENLTTVALFRVMEKFHPTLLVDEVDSFLKDNEEMRGMINAGHLRGGRAVRLVGDKHEPKTFDVAGPVALAGIGEIPPTIEDRSITIPLRRRLKNELIERLRKYRPELEVLARQIARWAADNIDRLSDDPSTPEELNDRSQDNWRPLIAIADAIGEAAGRQARATALMMELEREGDSDSERGIMCLTDVAAIFLQHEDAKTLSAEYIVNELVMMSERPWDEWRRGQPMTTNSLQRLLKPFGIKSKQLKEYNKKGYLRAAIIEAHERYCSGADEVEIEATADPKMSM